MSTSPHLENHDLDVIKSLDKAEYKPCILGVNMEQFVENTCLSALILIISNILCTVG